MNAFGQDLRHALRTLVKQPGYAALVVLTLALGVAANTAIYSVVHGVLLAPLPYEDAEDLMAVWGRFDPESGFDFPKFPLSDPEYLDYRDASRALEAVAAYLTGRATVTGGQGEPERVPSVAATANLFAVLRTEAALGRTFTAAEEQPGAGRVAVLQNGYWRSRFGGDPAVVGRSVILDGEPYEVVGVMPPGFAFPTPDVRLWTPLAPDPDPRNRQSHGTRAVGRLAKGATLAEAEAEMATLMAAWKEQYPDIHTGHYLFLRPLLADVTGNVRPALLMLLAAAGFMLLIVCANVASVVLARGEARHREVAIRTALGAQRQRIVRLLLGESLTLSAFAGVLGVGLAWLGVAALLRLNAGSIPRAESVGLDAPVLVFAGAVTLVTAALFGAVPAFQATRVDVQSHLRDGGRGVTAGGRPLLFRRFLVVAEVALAFLLVLGASLMAKSFDRLLRVDPGFSSERVLVAAVALPESGYGGPEQIGAFYRRLLERLGALPGVESASATSSLPLLSPPGVWDFEIEGAPAPRPGEMAWNATFSEVRPGFFATLGIELRRGRVFQLSDTADSQPVTVINEALARRFFPGEDPIGRRIRVRGGESAWMTIVGIVGDARYEQLASEARPAYYAVHDQSAATAGAQFGAMVLVARTAGDPLALAKALRGVVRELDPNLPVSALQTMDDVVATSVARPRFSAVLLGLFAAVALALGGTGIYGVLAYSVALRRREIGIRKALGARPGQLAAMVARQGLTLVGVGLAIGAAASWWALRIMASLLYGVGLTDGPTYAAVVAVLGLVALLACALPMLRAVRLDPLTALRAE